MSAPNNRAELSACYAGRTDFLLHDCRHSGKAIIGIKAGVCQSVFQVLVYEKTVAYRPSLVFTVLPPNSPMSFQDTMTPADARILAAGLIAAADHHDEITAREAAVLALARKTDTAVQP